MADPKFDYVVEEIIRRGVDEDKAAKLVRAIGIERTVELLKKNYEEMKEGVIYCEIQMKKNKEEVEANEKFVEAKKVIKLLNSGLTETNKEIRAARELQFLLVEIEKEKGE